MKTDNHHFTVWEVFERSADAYREKEAIYDQIKRISYGKLKEEAEHAAAMLVSLGIRPGDKVGVALPNWHETVILYLAVARIGAVLVPFNPKYRSHEMKHILNNSGAKLVFVSSEFEHIELDVIERSVDDFITVRYQRSGMLSYESLIGREWPIALPDVQQEASDTYCILYTSGTTGTPKGALITHHAIVQSGIVIGESMRCTEEDVFLILAPVFHVFGLGCNLLSAIYCGSRMVLLDKFKASKALELIQNEKVSIQHAVPSMLNLELKDPDFKTYDLSSLRAGMTGAAPCPPEIIRAVKEELGMVLSISYGATETCTVTITDYEDEEERIYQTIGKAVEGVEIKIVNDQREEVPYGQVGEIACRGFGIMKGYYQMAEQTSDVLDQDGWFYTGDLGTMDEHGYVRYVGRKKELIIRGGFNIYPQEIEALLQKHPKILENAVLGLPDPVMGEITCAAVKLKPGETATFDEIIEYLRPQIAPYKLPSKVVFVQELPSTASGKVQKVKLRDLIMQAH